MVSKIINDWLEEGFTETSKRKHGVRRENAFIPILVSDKGEIRTPKPLFPSFVKETHLEPDFLPNYLTNLKNKFRSAATINFDKYFFKSDDNKSPKEENIPERQIISIEYDRKSIYLSRNIFDVFEIPDSSVAKGSSQYPKVLEKNDLYQSALDRHKKFPENFKEQFIQTDFIDTVTKQIETIPMVFDDKTCMINNYIFKEHYGRQEMEIKSPPKTFKEYFAVKTKFCDYKGFLTNISNYPDILNRIQDALYVTEKTLDYNTYKISILKYNGCNTMLDNLASELPAVQNNEECLDYRNNEQEVKQPGVEHHLRFYLEKQQNEYHVSCMKCSPLNPNVFVAGYGVSRFEEMDHEPRGMVLCWNIHKYGYPEKIYHTSEIVTCLEFSKSEPYLVAVGMRYGLITILDLRKSEKSSTVNNYNSKIKPAETIKSIRWVTKKYAMGKEVEILLSVSMDGLIHYWNYERELDGHLLRYIKRGSDSIDEEHRLIVAIDAAGMCMQFKPNDDEIFIVGTIEGEALQANINDPESYVFAYKCHSGPLYDLQWSPLATDVFMTTGTNRFIHIWQMGKSKPSKSLTLDEVALKVAWSCVKSTLFAALCKTRILIFDLSIDLHKEIADYSAKGDIIFTSLNYCPRNNWLLIGQSDGTIELCELINIPDLITDEGDALSKTFLSE